jgi:tetratricopeptide (TPR) repeat protein
VADIFVSYTSADRDWAFWIGQELLKLGHDAHLHDWEISAGGNIMAWMDDRQQKANRVLCVVSSRYLEQPYSALERHGAQWAAVSNRPNFLLPVYVESCDAPPLFAPLKRCDLHGLNEDDARVRFATFMTPAAPPTGPISFPGTAKPSAGVPTTPVTFPGAHRALSNIPISVPRYFLGRDQILAEIKATLGGEKNRVAITALFGMRGVGKTTLAAAYAEQHCADYRATWWIRAETDPTTRADLVGLGVRMGWAAPDEKEEPALAKVMERLRHEGAGILLIFDNAIDADSVETYIPSGGDAQIIITSNAHAWRDVASPMQIDTWPSEIGADYLLSRTGGSAERQAALDLSNALGGLPLAHEQAAAYCERLEVSFATYQKRFDAAPVNLLDDKRDAPRAFHNRLTAAKAFAVAIDEAAKLHPAAEPLIVYTALLAPEPIPLFLFSEARERFGEPFASNVAGDGLDEAVAALRSFALIDREPIPDERNPWITTDCIRLHRLVREVAATRHEPEAREEARRILIEAVVACYSGEVWRDPNTWPRVRRLDAIALALVGGISVLPIGSEERAANLLILSGQYTQYALAAYAEAQPLFERSLAIREKLFGPEHPKTAISLSSLAGLLESQGDLAGARPYYERALAIREKVLGRDHPVTVRSLNNLGYVLESQGELASARPYYERALAISEKAHGPDHPDTAVVLNNLGALLQEQGDIVGARQHQDRALAIREKSLGPDHPDTAASLNNLGFLLRAQGDLAGARPYYERALAINEKALGAEHPTTKIVANNTAKLLEALKYRKEATALRKKFGIQG